MKMLLGENLPKKLKAGFEVAHEGLGTEGKNS